MTIPELCNLLEIPTEVTDKVITHERNIDFNALQKELESIQTPKPELWEKAINSMKEILAPDEDGMRILTCQLYCVLDTYENYIKRGISKAIFIDTMKFFSRFLQEYKDRHGRFCYVWAWWVPRQISMVEFRIGSLEYEMKTNNGKSIIDLHIPADAEMTMCSLRESYLNARKFIKTFFPEFKEADMVCSSWLLSPSLQNLLTENSRILQFQKSFEIGQSEENHLGFMDWVYGRRDIPIEKLPENTSLQKKLKPYLLNNGQIEWTFGKLIDDPFV